MVTRLLKLDRTLNPERSFRENVLTRDFWGEFSVDEMSASDLSPFWSFKSFNRLIPGSSSLSVSISFVFQRSAFGRSDSSMMLGVETTLDACHWIEVGIETKLWGEHSWLFVLTRDEAVWDSRPEFWPFLTEAVAGLISGLTFDFCESSLRESNSGEEETWGFSEFEVVWLELTPIFSFEGWIFLFGVRVDLRPRRESEELSPDVRPGLSDVPLESTFQWFPAVFFRFSTTLSSLVETCRAGPENKSNFTVQNRDTDRLAGMVRGQLLASFEF